MLDVHGKLMINYVTQGRQIGLKKEHFGFQEITTQQNGRLLLTLLLASRTPSTLQVCTNTTWAFAFQNLKITQCYSTANYQLHGKHFSRGQAPYRSREH